MNIFTQMTRVVRRCRRLSRRHRQSNKATCLSEKLTFSPVVPLILIGLIAVGSVLMVYAQGGWHQIYISSRVGLDIEDLGSAQVAGTGGGSGSFSGGWPPDANGQIPLWRPLGTGTGSFFMSAIIPSGGAGPSSMRLDGWMTTTFGFWFSAPTSLPAGTSLPQFLGFISFDEMNAFAAVDATQSSPGSWGKAEAKVWTFWTGNLAWAQVPQTFSPNYAESADPPEGYRRATSVMSVNFDQGYGEYVFPFSGFVDADPTGPGAFARVIAYTGIVVLSNPDPLGVPEVGDNEYVYQEPGGVGVKLVIPCQAIVIGGDSDTTEYFRPKLDWTLTLFLPDAWSRNPNIIPSPGIISAESRQDAELERGLVFGGYGKTLPASNANFGWYPLTMTYNGGNVHTANIEVFYPAQGYRHPAGGPPGVNFLNQSVDTPNYIHYYSQVYDSAEVVYQNYGTSHYDHGDTIVYVADNYAAVPYALRLFRDVGGVISHSAGDLLFLRGIHSYIKSVAHERGHRDDYWTLLPSGERILGDRWRQGDSDGDGLNDAWEEQHGFDPTKPDTASAYQGTGSEDIGDSQASADIQAYGALMAPGVRDLWRQDWAYWADPNMCMQYGNPFGQWQPCENDPNTGAPIQRLKPIPWECEAWGCPPPPNTNTTVEPLNYLRRRINE
jgi:hypothetical protein